MKFIIKGTISERKENYIYKKWHNISSQWKKKLTSQIASSWMKLTTEYGKFLAFKIRIVIALEINIYVMNDTMWCRYVTNTSVDLTYNSNDSGYFK